MSSMVSVRSSGWNQSLTGQESKGFTRPYISRFHCSFEEVFTAIDAFDLELLADLMSSSRRISAGSMI